MAESLSARVGDVLPRSLSPTGFPQQESILIQQRIISRIIYSNIQGMFSKKSRYLLHDGPEIEQDRDNREHNKQLWNETYLPGYVKVCKRKGIPQEVYMRLLSGSDVDELQKRGLI